jgi:hypothetical protein
MEPTQEMIDLELAGKLTALWNAYEKNCAGLDDLGHFVRLNQAAVIAALRRTRALEPAAPVVDEGTPGTIGHYFEFKRGTWVVDAAGKKTTYPGGGLAYVGSLTEAAKNGLDELISEYVAKEGAKTQQETEKVCAHRHYKTHCRICRIAELERELAAALSRRDAALEEAAKVCEGRIDGAVKDDQWWRGFKEAMNQCAKAIRALKS